jgi:hypothetical protein
LVVVLIFFLSLMYKPSKNGPPALGYITIGQSYNYPDDISTFEKATETCNLRCQNVSKSVVTNFPLYYITCYCDNGKYFVDTRTLEDLTSQEIARREKNQ